MTSLRALLPVLLLGAALLRNPEGAEARHGVSRNARLRILAEMERSLEQRLAHHLPRESAERASRGETPRDEDDAGGGRPGAGGGSDVLPPVGVDPATPATGTGSVVVVQSSIPGLERSSSAISEFLPGTVEEMGEYSSIIQDSNTVPVLVVPRLEEGASDYLDPLVARTERRPIQFRPVKPAISEKLNKFLGGSPGREKRQDEFEPLLPEKITVCETRYDWVLLNRTWDKDGQEVEIFHGKYAQYVHVYYCANKGGSCSGISEEFTSECLEKEAFAKLLVKKEPGADGVNYQLAVVQIPHHCFCQLTKKPDM